MIVVDMVVVSMRTNFFFGPPVYIAEIDPKYITEMEQNIDTASIDEEYSARANLAGRIVDQYQILALTSEACKGHILQHVNQMFYDTGAPTDGLNEQIEIDALWVNMQRYMEFNPAHAHGGMLSFVIYIKNDLQKEVAINNKFDNARGTELAGHLQLRYGEEQYMNWSNFTHWPERGQIIMFPSWLQHFVFPHYEQDKVRISVAGNIVPLQSHEE